MPRAETRAPHRAEPGHPSVRALLARVAAPAPLSTRSACRPHTHAPTQAPDGRLHPLPSWPPSPPSGPPTPATLSRSSMPTTSLSGNVSDRRMVSPPNPHPTSANRTSGAASPRSSAAACASGYTSRLHMADHVHRQVRGCTVPRARRQETARQCACVPATTEAHTHTHTTLHEQPPTHELPRAYTDSSWRPQPQGPPHASASRTPAHQSMAAGDTGTGKNWSFRGLECARARYSCFLGCCTACDVAGARTVKSGVARDGLSAGNAACCAAALPAHACLQTPDAEAAGSCHCARHGCCCHARGQELGSCRGRNLPHSPVCAHYPPPVQKANPACSCPRRLYPPVRYCSPIYRRTELSTRVAC